METVWGVVILVVFIWLVVKNSAGKDKKPSNAVTSSRERRPTTPRAPQAQSKLRVEIDSSVQRDYGRLATPPELRQVRPKKTDDHVAARPSGSADEAWSPRTKQLEVAGEWYRATDLRKLFTKHAKVSESGAEIRLPAVLVPDPANPHDARAVGVFVDRLHVGYMERPDAQKYHRAIAALPRGELTVSSRQWLRATADDTWARVTLSLPEPSHLTCPNPVRSSAVSLPPGSTIQVTKEEDFMDHLVDLLERYGSETVVCASLRAVLEQRPRSTVELVAVDIDGGQVGVLSTTQTANFLPLVRRAEADGKPVTCRASLRGNSLKADVALHARKAHEMDENELRLLFED